MKKYLIYEGTEFTLEWYYNTKGKMSAYDYFQELSEDRKDKAFYLFEKLGDTGKIFNKQQFRHEDDQIYAFKPKPDRFYCFFYEGSKVIVTNACEKKQDKLSPREKDKALRAREDYKKRCKGGTYYD